MSAPGVLLGEGKREGKSGRSRGETSEEQKQHEEIEQEPKNQTQHFVCDVELQHALTLSQDSRFKMCILFHFFYVCVLFGYLFI